MTLKINKWMDRKQRKEKNGTAAKNKKKKKEKKWQTAEKRNAKEKRIGRGNVGRIKRTAAR